MNRWFAYLLLTAGAVLILRARGATASGILSGLTGDSGTGTGGSGVAAGGSYNIGQVGSTFVQSNSLADAVNGLVGKIWGSGGQGYGGYLSLSTPDGTLNYRPPTLAEPLNVNPRTGKIIYTP